MNPPGSKITKQGPYANGTVLRLPCGKTPTQPLRLWMTATCTNGDRLANKLCEPKTVGEVDGIGSLTLVAAAQK